MDNPTDQVKAWVETVAIPTYRIGTPDKNPMFLEKRVYQGSSGVVYPHPIIDRIFDEKEDQLYTAVFLENRYLKIMLLPELGGRVQMALDKTNNYHFVYYNRVIKPALVGLTGPWISGGIEFNWPQHHRPSTFEPVDYRLEANADGGQTVWFSEIERMFRTKGMAGLTLYPDRAYLEIKVQLYNRTPHPQTFLWWANPAVAVNDDYQSIFPPDVHAVMDHGKRDVSSFPIATGTYYKMDYSPGTDISRYKNIPVPTSYMAYHSDFDFLGCYDHGRQAGMMHVANHHTVPGKKQWTWGNGNFGKAWDRQLTDNDGPYIELMCGAYTDNQPDFSWLMPGEEKRFTQIFMPYKLIGGATNANAEAVINLEISGQTAQIGVYVTRPRRVTIQLVGAWRAMPLHEQAVDLDPTTAYTAIVDLTSGFDPTAITLRVLDGEQAIISFTPLAESDAPIPPPATAAKPPTRIGSNDELYLNGLHLEQYRHATYAPEAYYKEALRRDPGDYRCNVALGSLLLRRGKFAEAEAYFRTAIERLTSRNPNPYDGEAYYQLGLALRLQGRYDEAYDAFYKAVWNAAWQDSAYFELARIASRRGQYAEALDLVERALARNRYHHQAYHLKIALLRYLGQPTDAALTEALALDGFNLGALYEQQISIDDPMPPINVSSRIEIALDYAHAGLFDEARVLLEGASDDTLARYYLGWMMAQAGYPEAALTAFQSAAQLSPDYVFPNEIECVPALLHAITYNPDDAQAHYYLGNFWYAHRRYDEAIEAWENARHLDAAFPTVWRNLGLAYVNQRGDLDAGFVAYEKAFTLNPDDARVLFELDQLSKRRNELPSLRLKRLTEYFRLVAQRDDLAVEYIALQNLMGLHAAALGLLTSRRFHPWEGGEGKVTGQYVLTLVELAKQAISEGDFAAAITGLRQAQTYPPNLGEGKLAGAQENHLHYYLGVAYAGTGDGERARAEFERAAVGLSEPTSPMFYNDQPPEMIFYQGKALQKLGRKTEARAIFTKLIDYGVAHLDDQVSIDYFAVSLPDFLVFEADLNQRNQIHCHFMQALGYYGLSEVDRANEEFDAVLALDASHLGAVIHKAMLQRVR